VQAKFCACLPVILGGQLQDLVTITPGESTHCHALDGGVPEPLWEWCWVCSIPTIF